MLKVILLQKYATGHQILWYMTSKKISYLNYCKTKMIIFWNTLINDLWYQIISTLYRLMFKLHGLKLAGSHLPMTPKIWCGPLKFLLWL